MRYFVRRREASACLIMLSTKQVATGTIFNAFGMAQPGFEPTTSRSRSGCSTTEPAGPVSLYIVITVTIHTYPSKDNGILYKVF